MMIFFLGFLVLVICVLVLSVRIILVVLLFCIVRFWIVGLLFASLMVVLFWLSLVFVVLPSVLLLFMLLTVIQIVTLFCFIVLILSILLFLLFCAAIATRVRVRVCVRDRSGSCPFDVSRENSALLSALFSDFFVVDIWRERHPIDSAFTWFRPDGALASCIDLIGCLYAWVPYVSCVDILPCPFSDHCALYFSWALPNSVPPGPGLWKLNRSVLDEAEYIDLISTFWSYWQSRLSSFSSLTGWWDSSKSHIKRISINYCVNRSKCKVVERDILSKLAAQFMLMWEVSFPLLGFVHRVISVKTKWPHNIAYR